MSVSIAITFPLRPGTVATPGSFARRGAYVHPARGVRTGAAHHSVCGHDRHPPAHMLVTPPARRDDPLMAETLRPDGPRPATATQRRHSGWMWVSALLAIATVGVTIWALTLRSDRDDTQQELDKTKQELASSQEQLDTTKQQLTTAQQDAQDLQS